MKRKNIRFRLIIFFFLEFAVWGSYLTSLGNFLARSGLATDIFWFYTVQGIVTLFMPVLMGHIADSRLSGRKVVGLCQIMSFIFKGAAFAYCLCADRISFAPLFVLFAISIAFYIPTIGLGNALALRCLKQQGDDTTKIFPRLRLFGTVGFIAAMLMVNFIEIGGMRLQASPWQIALAAIFSLLAAWAVFRLPEVSQPAAMPGKRLSVGYRSLLSDSYLINFLIFSFLIGICLQITNSYGNNYITDFSKIPGFSSTWGASNANAVISVSQISETLCILLIPFALRRLGIKLVIVISAAAWSLRFLLLAVGDTGSGLVFILLSMIVYGIAFDFLNIAGSMYVDRLVEPGAANRGQSLFMLVTGGLGAAIGTPLAGMVVNGLVFSRPDASAQLDGWREAWIVFAIYAAIVALLAVMAFRGKPSSSRLIHDVSGCATTTDVKA